MEAMRESWTDARLDEGFDRVNADLRAIRAEVSSARVETNTRFERLEERSDGQFKNLEERFDGRSQNLEERFDDRFTHLEERFNGQFKNLDDRFGNLENRFDRFDDHFDRWQRMMLSMFGGLAIALLGIVLRSM
jgi:predicted nuclease with TOPRIM domain